MTQEIFSKPLIPYHICTWDWIKTSKLNINRCRSALQTSAQWRHLHHRLLIPELLSRSIFTAAELFLSGVYSRVTARPYVLLQHWERQHYTRTLNLSQMMMKLMAPAFSNGSRIIDASRCHVTHADTAGRCRFGSCVILRG